MPRSPKSLLWLWPLLFLFACSHQGVRAPEPRQRPLEAGCQPLTEEDRERILQEAAPGNFPSTRYRRGPSSARGIEREADCSTFVHEVYKRAGLPYRFAPTAGMGELREFDLLPENEAKAGDMMLFRGHVGIVNEEGKIISALSTRYRKRKSSIAAIDRKHFKSFRGKRYVLRYRCVPESETVAALRRKAREERAEKMARAAKLDEAKQAKKHVKRSRRPQRVVHKPKQPARTIRVTASQPKREN